MEVGEFRLPERQHRGVGANDTNKSVVHSSATCIKEKQCRLYDILFL
jgi:hypothetical protein